MIHPSNDGTVIASTRRYGKPGDNVWVEVYYQREMHWNRVMAKATVVDKPFWFPARRGMTPPAPF